MPRTRARGPELRGGGEAEVVAVAGELRAVGGRQHVQADVPAHP